MECYLGDILTIKGDTPTLYVVETEEEAYDCTLASAGWSNQSIGLAGGHNEGYVLQDGFTGGGERAHSDISPIVHSLIQLRGQHYSNQTRVVSV